jgi:hypothetical protein
VGGVAYVIELDKPGLEARESSHEFWNLANKVVRRLKNAVYDRSLMELGPRDGCSAGTCMRGATDFVEIRHLKDWSLDCKDYDALFHWVERGLIVLENRKDPYLKEFSRLVGMCQMILRYESKDRWNGEANVLTVACAVPMHDTLPMLDEVIGIVKDIYERYLKSGCHVCKRESPCSGCEFAKGNYDNDLVNIFHRR